jgi:hypothetical protein
VPSRILIELLHLGIALGGTWLITAACIWAYPLGRGVIEGVGWASAAAVLAMSVGPLRRAWAADQRGSDVR